MEAAQRIPTHVLPALWEQGQPPDGALIESCTGLTTKPNEWLRPIHNQMPVIPSPASYDQWLDPTCQRAESLKALLCPYASEALLADSVGTLVNNS
jgi:putative SOS response-associated peptidase YedK